MTRDDTLRGFDPNAPGTSDTLWGLPFTAEEAALVIIPVPWEVTVSYGEGTAGAPAAVLSASSQVDLENPAYPDMWKRGIAMQSMPTELAELGRAARGTGVDAVHDACEQMVAHVRDRSKRALDEGKRVAVLGGDHSVPLGFLRELSERHAAFGILHIDAHCDLRDAYEGYVHSHASIMTNAMMLESITKLVQVGVRDFCEEERLTVETSNGRIELFDDYATSRRRFEGETWSAICDEIVGSLPNEVYISFDVDGLDPALCPGTGTPVPGGLAYEEALLLVERVVAAGRRIIGFDLCEVSPKSAWDANVGARLLYRLSCALLAGEQNG